MCSSLPCLEGRALAGAQRGWEDGGEARQNEWCSPFLGVCVCVHAREDSIRDAWGSAFTAACAGSPRLCSMTGGTRCGQCLITFGTGQPGLSPGLPGPCRHLCPGAFCPAWPLARVCVCAQSLGKSVPLLLKLCSVVVRVVGGIWSPPPRLWAVGAESCPPQSLLSHLSGSWPWLVMNC